MLALLTDMVKAKWSEEAVHTQIIQTIAILVQNVRNETSLYYLLSNNYVNEIIAFQVEPFATAVTNLASLPPPLLTPLPPPLPPPPLPPLPSTPTPRHLVVQFDGRRAPGSVH